MRRRASTKPRWKTFARECGGARQILGNTRFRNGSSVADCVLGLACCSVLVIGDRSRSHFALAEGSGVGKLLACVPPAQF
jgi:hypothetical protein